MKTYYTVRTRVWCSRSGVLRPMRVTIQYQEVRNPHRWKNAFTARVLFADRQIVLVRGAGSHSTFDPNGPFKSAGWRREHPAAKSIPKRHGTWRLHPKSVDRLKARSSRTPL